MLRWLFAIDNCETHQEYPKKLYGEVVCVQSDPRGEHLPLGLPAGCCPFAAVRQLPRPPSACPPPTGAKLGGSWCQLASCLTENVATRVKAQRQHSAANPKLAG